MLIRELIYQEMIEDIKKCLPGDERRRGNFVSDRYDLGA